MSFQPLYQGHLPSVVTGMLPRYKEFPNILPLILVLLTLAVLMAVLDKSLTTWVQVHLSMPAGSHRPSPQVVQGVQI